MNLNDQRIREFAYQIWESEGKPQGQDLRHWDMAYQLVMAQEATPPCVSLIDTSASANASLLDNPATSSQLLGALCPSTGVSDAVQPSEAKPAKTKTKKTASSQESATTTRKKPVTTSKAKTPDAELKMLSENPSGRRKKVAATNATTIGQML